MEGNFLEFVNGKRISEIQNKEEVLAALGINQKEVKEKTVEE